MARETSTILDWPYWVQLCPHARVVLIDPDGYGCRVAYGCPICEAVLVFKWPPKK